MKAVLLCAGFGTRLGSLTKNRPKPMLPIGGSPLLVHIINHLKAYGIKELAINLHYQPEQIQSVIGDGHQLGVSVSYSHETVPLGTAGALLPMADWLVNEEAFLVYYGDIFTNQNLAALIERHFQKNSYATLLLHQRHNSNSFVKRDNRGRITCFVERPSEKERKNLGIDEQPEVWVNSGIQILSRKALRDIVKDRLYDLPKDLYANRYSQESIFSIALTGFRIAVDSPQRYAQACVQWDSRMKREGGENQYPPKDN